MRFPALHSTHTPALATSLKHTPDNTRANTKASPCAGNAAQTPTTGAAGTLATSPRTGAIQGHALTWRARPVLHPAWLSPETPASFCCGQAFGNPGRAQRPARLRTNDRANSTAGTSATSLPWSHAQHNPGQLCPSPVPRNPTPPPNLSTPSAAVGRLPSPLRLAPGANLLPSTLPVDSGKHSTSVTKRFATKLREEKGRRGGALRGPRETLIFREVSGNPAPEPATLTPET